MARKSVIYQVAVIIDGVAHAVEEHHLTDEVNEAIVDGSCSNEDDQIVEYVVQNL